jgi:hypothetical protein
MKTQFCINFIFRNVYLIKHAHLHGKALRVSEHFGGLALKVNRN